MEEKELNSNETVEVENKEIAENEIANVETENAEVLENENIEADNADAQKQNEIASAKENAKWYALHTFTGYEQLVEENLQRVIEKNRAKLEHRIFDIIIPTEDVIEEKRGKRKIITRKLMPGYVLVKMVYADDIWHDVTRTRGITGFVGPKGRPLPLSDEEVARLKLEKIKIDVNIKVGDKIEIVDGPLISQIGDITYVDKTTGKVKANVNMFGRVMTVDLELSQIRKI